MIIRSFYRLLEISDPYEPAATIGIYEDVSLITEEKAVIYVREATPEDIEKFGEYTKDVYKNIHTNIEEAGTWSGLKNGLIVEEVDVHFLK